MSRKLLVTGGLGYVGGRLCRNLCERGNEVRVGTRRPEQARPAWLTRGGLVKVDVLDEATLAQAVEGADAVIHLAALNEIDAARDPESALTINTLGTLRLVRAAARAGVRRFVFFSTAHVYGAPLEGKLTEDLATRPMHPYSYTHRAAEDIVFAARAQGITEPVVVRLSNGIGAPERASVDRWTLVVNDLCRQAVTLRELRLKSSGLQVRDFVTLGDVARATEHLLALPGDRLADGLFNLGGAHTETVLAMAQRIQRCYQAHFGTAIPLHRPEPSPSDPVVHPLDFSIAKLLGTGFALTGDLDGEILATLRVCAAELERIPG